MTGAQLNCFKCHNLHKPIPSNPTLYWTLTQLDIIITYTSWSQLSTSVCPPEITLPTSGDSLQTQTSSGYKNESHAKITGSSQLKDLRINHPPWIFILTNLPDPKRFTSLYLTRDHRTLTGLQCYSPTYHI